MPPSSLCQGVLDCLVLYQCSPSWLHFPPAFPKAILNSHFFWASPGVGWGGSPWGHCEPWSALPLWEWVHVQLESPSLLSFSVSFASLAYLMCGLILYRIFVCHPYSCQPFFSLRESLALDCLLEYQSHPLKHVSFFLNCQMSGFLQVSLFPITVLPLYIGEHIPERVLKICCQPLASQHLEIAAAGKE